MSATTAACSARPRRAPTPMSPRSRVLDALPGSSVRPGRDLRHPENPTLPAPLSRDHEASVMIAAIMDVQLHDQSDLDGVFPSWSGAVPPGDLASVRPRCPAGAHPSRPLCSYYVYASPGQDQRLRDRPP